jgi:hypothetical protein
VWTTSFGLDDLLFTLSFKFFTLKYHYHMCVYTSKDYLLLFDWRSRANNKNRSLTKKIKLKLNQTDVGGLFSHCSKSLSPPTFFLPNFHVTYVSYTVGVYTSSRASKYSLWSMDTQTQTSDTTLTLTHQHR